MIRIMLADDNRDSSDALKRVIDSQTDMEVIAEARDGAEAVTLARKAMPDFAFVDLVMPSLDGLTVIERISALGLEKTPSVALMAQDCLIDALGRLSGWRGVTVINKPANPAQALSLVRGSQRRPPSTACMPELEYAIFVLLNELGLPGHLSGSGYLKQAAVMTALDFSVLDAMDKRLYPVIAQKFATTEKRVERCMRYAVEIAFNRGRVRQIENLFGYTVKGDTGRPTNAEFIAMVAERARLRLRA